MGDERIFWALVVAVIVLSLACAKLYLDNQRLQNDVNESNARQAVLSEVLRDVIRIQMDVVYTREQRDLLTSALLKVGAVEKSVHVNTNVNQVGENATVGQTAAGEDVGQAKRI